LPLCTTSDSKAEICLFYSHRELLPVRLRTFIDYCTQFFRSSARYDAMDTETAIPAKAYGEEYRWRPVEARRGRTSPFDALGR
jgi:hypothetical protein